VACQFVSLALLETAGSCAPPNICLLCITQHMSCPLVTQLLPCRDLAAAAGVESVLPAKLVKGSIERADEWKSTIIDKPVFETHEGCVAKEVWKRALA